MAQTQLRVRKETLVKSCTALDTTFEQSVEKDLVLPDYCPDVFRILKCRVTPRITSQSLNGDKLTIESEAVIKVMYLSENSGRVNLLEQKLEYSRSLDIGQDCTSPTVCALPRTDHINCRVVNQRRVDIRGAFSVRVKVTCEGREQFITDAEGAGIQLRRVNTAYPARRLTASKRITVIEELGLGGAKPPVGAVIRSDCRVERREMKIIPGKLITKGEATVEMLYVPADSESPALETMRFGIPFSQVIDIDGLEEDFTVDIETASPYCDIIPKADDPSSLECELIMLVNCTAVKYESCSAVTDAFSTLFEHEAAVGEAVLGGIPRTLSSELAVTGELKYGDGAISGISWAGCEAGSVSVRCENGAATVSGNLTVSAVGTNTSGTAIYLENDFPFEQRVESIPEGAEAAVEVRACSYHLSDDSTAEVKAELVITLRCEDGVSVKPLTELSVDTDSPLERCGSCAVKLCFVNKGEQLWDIAKRYRTSVSAMTEENEMTSDKTEESGMLLIPLIN